MFNNGEGGAEVGLVELDARREFESGWVISPDEAEDDPRDVDCEEEADDS